MKQITDNQYEQLSDYLDGTLPAPARTALEAELAANPALQQELTELRSTVVLLRDLPPLALPRSFTLDPALYAAPRSRWAFGWMRWSAVLGLLLVFILVGVNVIGSGTSKQVSMSADRTGSGALPPQTELQVEEMPTSAAAAEAPAAAAMPAEAAAGAADAAPAAGDSANGDTLATAPFSDNGQLTLQTPESAAEALAQPSGAGGAASTPIAPAEPTMLAFAAPTLERTDTSSPDTRDLEQPRSTKQPSPAQEQPSETSPALGSTFMLVMLVGVVLAVGLFFAMRRYRLE